MKNKIFLIVLVIVLIVAAGFLAWKFLLPVVQKGKIPNLLQTNFEIPVPKTLPEIDPLSNPVKNKLPALNPVDKTNPFSGLKVNPFK